MGLLWRESICAVVNEDVEWGGDADYSLREMALILKGCSKPYLSWSENNFLYVPNVLV